MTAENSRVDALTGLLPCPLCGGAAEIYNPFHMLGNPRQAATYNGGVQCTVCRCRCNATTPPDAAIAAWNRRAPVEQPAGAPIDGLCEKALAELTMINEALGFDADDDTADIIEAIERLKAKATAPSPADKRAAFDVALDTLWRYEQNWDTGLPAEYASAERIAMESACEAVREALEEARAASANETGGGRGCDPLRPRVCRHGRRAPL